MSRAGGVPASTHRDDESGYRRGLHPWLITLCLIGVFALLAVAVAKIHPLDFFGLSEDDSIYFSSAKALAAGHGYLLESVPGTPPATKYPVVYPWVLSWIWRGMPRFPANLGVGIGLNVVCGFVYIVAAFFLLRGLRGLGDWERVLLVAYCGLHPILIFHAGSLLSDLPFAAAVMSAMALTVHAFRREGSEWMVLCAGLLAGTAMSLRTLGLPVLFGLALSIAIQRRWRTLTFFASGALPACVGWLLVRKTPTPLLESGASLCSDVWRANWLYYMDYVGFWKVDLIQNHVLWPSVKQSLILLLLQPGSYLVELDDFPKLLAYVPALILSVVSLYGCWRWVRGVPFMGVWFALGFYAIPVVIWDYPAMSRFLIPFLPLFVAGAWLEGKGICGHILASIRANGLRKDGAAIVFLCFGISALVLAIGWSFWSGLNVLVTQGHRRAAIGSEKREAYDWIKRHSAADTTVIAYEDGALNLYSERKAFRPVIFLPAARFRPQILQSELDCIADSSRRLRADYWLVSEDDFSFEWQTAATRGLAREKEALSGYPVVFQSKGEDVRIYQLGSNAVSGSEPIAEPTH
jgi:hypothetical protein